MACVNLPEFPLQLLLLQHPEWRELPATVVDRDKAQGIVLWANRKARRRCILPGMRYAAALSLASDLRAGTVSESQLSESVERLTERLRFYSSDIEPSSSEPGIFWLDASGLSLLFPSLKKWAGLIHSDLTKDRFQCSVAVGFTRFGSYAIAKSSAGVTTFESPSEERDSAGRVPIVELGIDPKLRDLLTRLGVNTLGGFIALPSNGVRKRFGPEMHRLYKLARGELYSPLDATPPPEPIETHVDYDHPEFDLGRLVAVIESRLSPLLEQLQTKNAALSSLTLRFVFDNGEKKEETLQAASPTLDLPQIIDLTRLRLESTTLAAGVTEMTIVVQSVTVTSKQGDLFSEKSPRDLPAAGRAFARLRAEFGEDAVVTARLRDAHLPEAQFVWEPVHEITPPRPRNVRLPPLVRRIFQKPRLVSHGRPRAPDEQLNSFIDDGLISEPIGPYIVSGGWWVKEVRRDYYYVQTRHDRSLWIYYDRLRKRWFLHGAVE